MAQPASSSTRAWRTSRTLNEGTKGSPSREVKPYDLTTRPEIDMQITDKTIDFMDRNAAVPVDLTVDH